MKNTITLIVSWLITLVIPFVLIGLGIRVLLTPLFPNIEYRVPYFPPDIYGFSMQDRLRWGMDGINYLLNNADISYLGDLQLSGAPLFTEPELSHMHDVKVVVQNFLKLWYIVSAVLILLGVWAWFGKWWSAFSQGIGRGGWLTLLLAITIGVIATIGASGNGDLFWSFFAGFHGLFFQGNSWLFPDSDTLIRLYPLQFWQDAVLYIGIISALGAIGCIFIPRIKQRGS
ncbi:MAG TPA: TIGR01906 family membrane protein [Anaerolineales bacterium]|nr:TIGR01906 family membrane protein [Anaerolineales bacterium]